MKKKKKYDRRDYIVYPNGAVDYITDQGYRQVRPPTGPSWADIERRNRSNAIQDLRAQEEYARQKVAEKKKKERDPRNQPLIRLISDIGEKFELYLQNLQSLALSPYASMERRHSVDKLLEAQERTLTSFPTSAEARRLAELDLFASDSIEKTAQTVNFQAIEVESIDYEKLEWLAERSRWSELRYTVDQTCSDHIYRAMICWKIGRAKDVEWKTFCREMLMWDWDEDMLHQNSLAPLKCKVKKRCLSHGEFMALALRGSF